jgi:hypothetical protein
MSIKVGTTDIVTVGKIKLGTSNITKVYKGTTQIWPVASFYSFPAGSFSSTNGTGACAISPTGNTYYSNVSTPTIGNTMYTNSSLTTVLNGAGQWFSIGGSMYGASYQINSSGVIIDAYNCGF